MNKTETTATRFPGNNRIHIALAVTDLERSREFYETLFGAPPSKERHGFLKFEPEDPSVNLTLNEVSDLEKKTVSVAHFGIQVKSSEAVQEAVARFTAGGLPVLRQESTTCCYAVQDKVWIADPDGNRWEVFVVLDASENHSHGEQSECCPATESEACTISAHHS